MENFRELAEIFLKNKDARKLLPIMKLFTKDPVMLSLIVGMECACNEFDKLCPTGEC